MSAVNVENQMLWKLISKVAQLTETVKYSKAAVPGGLTLMENKLKVPDGHVSPVVMAIVIDNCFVDDGTKGNIEIQRENTWLTIRDSC